MLWLLCVQICVLKNVYAKINYCLANKLQTNEFFL